MRREKAKALKESAAKEGEGALVRMETALAKVDNRIAKVEAWMEYNGVKYRSARSRSTGHHGAYAAGRRAGKSISVDSGGSKAIKS